ncbi:MAG: GNAT family N-acetyltransferase, partial [Chloroflexi bacterium]|nr:GNAT family N-acetyltransferase [Chloroflexota bacterium]
MGHIPTLTTARLILRPFTLEDAPVVKALAGAWEIAEMTAHIPHPYEDGVAEQWISTHQGAFDQGQGMTLAITRKADHALVGAISLIIDKENLCAELGYWVGVPYWR